MTRWAGLRRRAGRLAAALILAATAAGCAPVAPWERGTLAKPGMALDPHPMRTALLGHARNSREAATGSVSKGGGGCGCD
jgi:hypothetical protein